MRSSTRALLLLVMLLAVAVSIQAQNNSSTPAPAASASSNNSSAPSASISGNNTASVNGTSSLNATQSARPSNATSTVPLTTVDATPSQFANPQITAIAPGVSGTVASGPNDNYIAAAGRLASAQQTVIVGAGVLAASLWALA
ncbi:hypothetical protein ACM66B_001177 [Microbotryomycetes sp. NB124-2]